MQSAAKFNRRVANRYEQWMVIQHYTTQTKANYRQTIRLFLDFLKDKSLTRVTHYDIRNFIAKLSENGISINCARRHVAALRRFYDFLNLGGVVSYVAPRLLIVRQTPKKTPPHLSEEEMQRMIAAAQTRRERALIEFFYGTGCRMGEVRRLRVEELDLRHRTARVTGKFGKSRVVLMTESAADALRDYVGNRKTGYVFQQDRPPQRGCLAAYNGAWTARWRDYSKPGYPKIQRYIGSAHIISFERAKEAFDRLRKEIGPGLSRPKSTEPLTQTAVGTIIRCMGSRAGLSRAHPHMIRHSFATHLYENGADLLALQTLMGHVDISTTATYARVSAFKLVDTFERCHPLGSQHWRMGRKESPSERLGEPVEQNGEAVEA